MLSAAASGMMALTGIVFAMAFVMVQFSAIAYSPRRIGVSELTSRSIGFVSPKLSDAAFSGRALTRSHSIACNRRRAQR
jgi:hypothetical protein